MQSMSDNAIDKMSPEDRCNPVKAVKIGYPAICRAIVRAHRRQPAKSLIAMNTLSKIYQSEANEILKECSKLDRMLIRKNNPEAETESNSTVSIEKIMSGIKSARKESNVSEESTSEELLSWSRGNTEENKSSHKTLQPIIESTDGDIYEETPSMEDPSKLNDATIDDEELSTEKNPGNNIDAAESEMITSTRRNSSKQKTTNSNDPSKLNDATIDDEEFSTETNPGNNIDAAGSEMITSTRRNSSKQKTTNSNESISTTKGIAGTPSKVTKTSKLKINPSKLNDATIDDEELSTEKNPGNNIDAAESEMITSTRRNSSKQKTTNSNDPSKLNDATIDDEELFTEKNPGNNIDAAESEMITSTRRNSSKQKPTNSNGSRKRTRTSSRAIGTQTEEDTQPSSSRQRIQKPLLPSLPFGQLVVIDENGTPCKLVTMSINPKYFTNFNK
ncbi:uncharacterized protein LOC125063019 isoform X3 [Pieris napi]|uniref:uncharacterized protein LOC125063019 isoform X3 n=1 Tax=Pieris napi TaxID=78633 RepID=UPI001FBBFE3B|nr:uncharacterized protein LOC125063019 isoform X3 [Pieris napi]